MSVSLEITKKELHESLVDIMTQINILTTAVDVCFVVGVKSNGFYLACDLPPDVDVEDLEYTKDLLIFYRQYEIYIR